MRRLLPAVLTALGCAGAVPAPPTQAAPPAGEIPCHAVVEWLDAQRSRFAADLESAHTTLLERSRDSAPEFAARLTPDPPRPRAGSP
ncbi:MAG: hypothetical protein EYC70_02780 [Planctomycetota bacterium]|nr:MAG: hypothetical protein EYC70_02780 [Planctomycetota bacterium]